MSKVQFQFGMSQSQLTKRSVKTCSRFESRMGRIDYAAFTKMPSEGESVMAVRDHIKEIEGPLGLMIFNAIDHGILLSLAGKIARAKQYVVETDSHFR